MIDLEIKMTIVVVGRMGQEDHIVKCELLSKIKYG